MSHTAEKNQGPDNSKAAANSVSENGMELKPPVQKKAVTNEAEFISPYIGKQEPGTQPFRPGTAQLRTFNLKDGRNIITENYTRDQLEDLFAAIIAGDLAGGEAINAAIEAGEYINGRVVLDDTPYDAQETNMSCWYAALSMVLGYHNQGIPNYTHSPAYTAGIFEEIDTIMADCKLGMRVMTRDIQNRNDLATILQTYGPMMCLSAGQSHCLVIFGVVHETVQYYDPASAGVKRCTLQQALQNYQLYLQYNRASDVASGEDSDGDGDDAMSAAGAGAGDKKDQKGDAKKS